VLKYLLEQQEECLIIFKEEISISLN